MKHPDSSFDRNALSGKWWLPNNKENIIDGTLTGSDAEGYYLKTTFSFPDDTEFKNNHIIHGQVWGGNVTLLCSNIGARYRKSLRQLVEYIFRVDIVIKGAWLGSREELNFNRITSKFNILSEWINLKPFNLNYSDDRRKIDIDFKLPSKKEIYKSGSYSVYLDYHHQPPGCMVGQNSLSLDWEPCIAIESTNGELPWDANDKNNYLYILEAIKLFFAIGYYSPVYPFGITGRSDRLKETLSEKEYCKNIELNIKHEVVPSDSGFHRALFSWNMFIENSQHYMDNWMRSIDEIRIPTILFYSSTTNRNSYSPRRFFDLMSAIEGIHRYIFKDSSIHTKEHSGRIKSITESSPPEYREWLKEKLKYSHEPSMRNRVKELVEPFKSIFNWFIGGEDDNKRLKKIVGEMVEIRNRIAHSLPESGDNPRLDYLHLTRVAEVVIMMWLMKIIGFKHEIIEKQIKNNFFFKQYRAQFIEYIKSKS